MSEENLELTSSEPDAVIVERLAKVLREAREDEAKLMCFLEMRSLRRRAQLGLESKPEKATKT